MAGQEDDCDSLEQILRMIKNDEVSRSHNPSTQITRSFCVGGRISSVVDPEFRLPTVMQPSPQMNQQTNQTSGMFNPSFDNINQGLPGNGGQQHTPAMPNQSSTFNQTPVYHISTSSGLGNAPTQGYATYNNQQPNNQHIGGLVPMQQNSMASLTNQPGGPVYSNQVSFSGNMTASSVSSAPFTIQGTPSTFQDIAKRPPQMTGFSNTPLNIITSNTLQDYGPVSHDPQRGRVFITSRNYGPVTQQTIPQYPMGPASANSMPISSGPPAPSGSSFADRPMGPAPLGYAPPVNHGSNTTITTTTTATNNLRKEISPPPPPPPPEQSESSGNQTSSRSAPQVNKNPADPIRPSSVPVTRPPSSGPPADSRMIYSPTPIRRTSPPAQVAKTSVQSNPDKQPVANTTGSTKIPKLQTPKNLDNYDGMTLMDLQQRYRDYEFDITKNTDRLYRIEQSLADLTREAHGKNIELDPEFRKLKKEQDKHKEEAQRLRKSLNRIDEKLRTKFHHKMNPKENRSSAKPIASRKTPMKRAKMSTTSHRESSSSRMPSRERTTCLPLKDCNTWCEMCNEHFETITAYCDHLHTRDHKRCMPKINPWASSSKKTDQVNHEEALRILKSACSRASEELANDNFDLRDLDRVLNHTLNDREQVLKVRSLQRERGTIDPDDPLFQYKGYDYLVPISGFYCNLCSLALCDTREVERHMSSLDHNTAFIKCVALNRDREKTFRSKMAKSYKELYGERPNRSPRKSKGQPTVENGSQSGSSDPVPSTSGATSSSSSKPSATPVRLFLPPASSKEGTTSSLGVITTSTAPASADRSTHVNLDSRITSTTITSGHQYKKSTSHIVDLHEAVIEKFPTVATNAPRPAPKQPEKTRQTSENEKQPKKRPSTEIVSIGAMSRPTALKRLKNSRPPKSKPIVESEEDSDIEFNKKKTTKPRESPVIRDDDSDDQAAIGSNDSDVEFIKEVHLDKGDPDSPFPNLELSVTGNIHVSALKDPRLSAKCSVKLQLLRLEDYKDMLLDEASLMVRINQILAKKEPGQLIEEARRGALIDAEEPQPTFFDTHGNHIPVEIEDEDEGSQM